MMGHTRALAGRMIAFLSIPVLVMSLSGPAHAQEAVPEPQVVAVPTGDAPAIFVPRAVSAVSVRASTVRVRARWAMVEGASSYSVQLLAAHRNRHIVKRVVVAGSRARFFQELPVGSSVQVCVLAINAAGASPAVCRLTTVRLPNPSVQ